jgi:hypothetical protein
LQPTGLSNTQRIELLIAWHQSSGDQRFSDLALALARAPVDGLDSWRDGDDVIELIAKLRDGDYFDELTVASELANCLETATIGMIYSCAPDDLEKISDAAEVWKQHLGREIPRAVDEVIVREIDEVERTVENIDSESTLTEHIEMLQKLAKRTRVSAVTVSRAVETVMDRIAVVEGRSTKSSSLSVRASAPETDKFDDVALQNLFEPLVRR